LVAIHRLFQSLLLAVVVVVAVTWVVASVGLEVLAVVAQVVETDMQVVQVQRHKVSLVVQQLVLLAGTAVQVVAVLVR
jgi:hypothetical protein